MFSSRLIWVALIVGILFALPAAGSAAGAGEVGRPEANGYQQDFGVSAAVAQERLELQRRGTGIVEALEGEAGRDYAGILVRQ